MSLVTAWLVLVGVFGLPLWLFLSGVLSGYYGETCWNAPNGLLRRKWTITYWSVALLITLAGSSIAETAKRRARKQLEASDPCRYLKAEMQRKHPELDALANRQVSEIIALEKQGRRQRLYFELQSLNESGPSEDIDRAVEHAFRRVEREQALNNQHAEAWSKLSERHEREWTKACELTESASRVH